MLRHIQRELYYWKSAPIFINFILQSEFNSMQTFKEYYSANIASQIEPLEAKRIKLANLKNKRVKVFNIVILILGTVGGVYAWVFFGSFWVFFGALMCVGVALGLFQDQIPDLLLRGNGLSAFKIEYKDRVVRPIVHFVDPQWDYQPNGSLPTSVLTDSSLFHIGSNTKVEMDDIIKGQWQGQDLLIANVKTTSIVGKSDYGRQNLSSQSFNGIMVRLKTDITGSAYLVPKSKTSKAIHGLANMKFTRDPNMTYEEQKAHNLQSMGESFGGYTWNVGLANNAESLQLTSINDEGLKPYDLYTDNDQVKNALLSNEQLKALMSKQFKNQGAIDQLSLQGNFELLEKDAMDDLVSTSLTFALHSGYLWVLIPAFSDQFELNLNKKIDQQLVLRYYRNIQLALLSISPLLHAKSA